MRDGRWVGHLGGWGVGVGGWGKDGGARREVRGWGWGWGFGEAVMEGGNRILDHPMHLRLRLSQQSEDAEGVVGDPPIEARCL